MKKKIKPSFNEEKFYWNQGISCVIGLDEVGRGAFAGPIVAAGVVFKPNFKHQYLDKVNDSKLIRPKLREELSQFIKENSIWEIATIEVDYINEHGIGVANREVIRKALNKLILKLKTNNYFAIVDGFDLKIENQKGVIGGDRISISIASASIIAKVYRDQIMRDASIKYPNYNFAQNKGYGTLFHRNAIEKFGVSEIHRISFLD